jgi:hypothetical protein
VLYSVVVAPGGIAGDVVLGNGNYDLAKETLRSGRITIH